MQEVQIDALEQVAQVVFTWVQIVQVYGETLDV
jgi:hypothetical protein